jgi:hypothetical protein
VSENGQRTTIIDGFWIDREINKRRYIFNNEDLSEVATDGLQRDAALKRLKRQALQVIQLPQSDLTVLISEKPRMYTAKTPLDVMMLVVSEYKHRRVANLRGASESELGNLLKHAKRILNGLKDVAEQVGQKVKHQALAVNFHEDPLSSEGVSDLRKLHAQTLDMLHFHAFVLTEDEVKNSVGKLNKSERDVAYDPLNFIIEYLMDIPSIAEIFSHHSLERLGDDKLRFKLDEDADDSDFADSIIMLHNSYEHIYKKILELFIDKHNKSVISMPLLDGEDSWGNIKSFIRKLRNHPLNRDVENIQPKIDRLFALLKRLNKIFKDADREHLLSDERLFLHSPAYTMVMEINELEEWIITLSPRLISTGNALHSLGYFKQSSENNTPDKKWWEMRKKMLKIFNKFS